MTDHAQPPHMHTPPIPSTAWGWRIMKPVPVLFVDHAPAMGGAENSLKLLLEHLDPERWDLHLACAPGSPLSTLQHPGVSIHKLDFPPLRHALHRPGGWGRCIRDLAHLCTAVHARAMVSNTIRSSVYTAAAARLSRTPFVWTMRDFWWGESQPRHVLPDMLGKQLLCTAAHTVITNSHATALQVPCEAKITVIHNGIDVAQFTPLPQAPARSTFHLPVDTPVIGMVGRLRPWKGQLRFLRVLKRVMAAHPHIHGIVVGGTPLATEDTYAAQLHSAVHNLDLTDHVIFTGQLEDIRPALAAMDVFVHPGDPEPFGLVNIEAMAMAKPVVAFAHGALPEIVVHDETGLLIPPMDETAMANAIISLLQAPSRARTLGTAGRQRVEQAFTIQRTARDVDKVLSTIVFKGS